MAVRFTPAEEIPRNPMPQFGASSAAGLGSKPIPPHPPRLPGARPGGDGAGHGLGDRTVSLAAVRGIVCAGAGGTEGQRRVYCPGTAPRGGCGSISRTE